MTTMLEQAPLKKQRDYRLLLSARAVSETGTEVSRLAVPMTAALLLDASPLQMGILAATTSLPYLLFGLQAGALADRLRRHRPVMIACELVSAAAMATIPVTWIAGLLTVPWLIAMAFVIGTCSVIFRAVNFPHLVTVVHESQRTEALAGFQSVYALASVGGPGLAGLLVQLITAPFALLADAVSFLVSAFLIRRIAAPENHTPAPPRGMWIEIREGLHTVVRHPTLRALCGCGLTINFFGGVYMAVFVIYALNVLELPAGLIGALTAFFGAGGLLGAAVVPRLTKRFGENRMLAYSVLLFPIDFVVAALASGPVWSKFLLMSASGLISGMAVVAFAVCLGTIALRETPAELMGRVNATLSFTIQGVLTFGGLAGGLLGTLLGLRPVLWIGAVGILLTIPWIWFSPLRDFSAREAR
jgi:MFS family permease